MRAKKYLVSLLLAAAVAVPAVPAHAMTWGADVFGAFSTHSMGDVNDAIDASNADPISPTNFDNVNNSFGGGIGLRVKPNSTWMFEGTWEPLFPSTEDKNTSGDKINLDANSFQLTGTYWLPSQATNKFGLAAGIGYYTLNGKIQSVGNPDIKVSGNGVGFHILGTGEWEVSPGFGFFGSAGYRMAKIGDTKFDDPSLGLGAQSTDPKSETDFSGFTARAGLAFYMVPSGSSH